MAALTPQRSRNSSTNSVPSMGLTSRISTGTCAPIARLCTRMSLAANALTECKSSFLYSVAFITQQYGVVPRARFDSKWVCDKAPVAVELLACLANPSVGESEQALIFRRRTRLSARRLAWHHEPR